MWYLWHHYNDVIMSATEVLSSSGQPPNAIAVDAQNFCRNVATFEPSSNMTQKPACSTGPESEDYQYCDIPRCSDVMTTQTPFTVATSHVTSMPSTITTNHVTSMPSTITTNHVTSMPSTITTNHVTSMPSTITTNHVTSMPSTITTNHVTSVPSTITTNHVTSMPSTITTNHVTSMPSAIATSHTASKFFRWGIPIRNWIFKAIVIWQISAMIFSKHLYCWRIQQFTTDARDDRKIGCVWCMKDVHMKQDWSVSQWIDWGILAKMLFLPPCRIEHITYWRPLG